MTQGWRARRRGLLWLAGLAPFFYLSYGLANHWAATRAAVPSVVFDWERQVPFWAWTVLPYWTLNAFYGLSLLLVASRHEADRHGLRLLTAQLVAVACFVAWPLRFSFGQPEVDPATLPGQLFTALRAFDQPFNQSPSLHVALALVLWDFYRRRVHGRFARVLLHGWTLAICASVLTTWQHHFIDIPTGALLGLLCIWAWPLERRVSMRQAWHLSGSQRRRQLAGRYVAGAAALALLAVIGSGAALWLLWPAVSLLLVAACYLGFGARGFQMDAQGRMAWAARALLAPYRMGARVNGWWWTRGLPATREVLPGVALGSVARLGAPPMQGPSGRFTLVSLCAELQGPALHPCLCQPWLDLVPASAKDLKRAAATIERAVQAGGPVVVGCALGFSRSVAAMACWLTRSGRMGDLDAALQHLRRAHPQLVLGDDWHQALQQATQ